MKTIPYSEEAEVGLIGCIMIDAEIALGHCVENGLRPEWFYVPAHRIIADGIFDMLSKVQVINLLTVADYLRDRDQLDSVGGYEALDLFIDRTPVASHVHHYLEGVRNKYELRRAIEVFRTGEARAMDPDASSDDVVSKADYDLSNLTETAMQTVRSGREVLDDQIPMWEEARDKGCIGVHTGFRIIDSYFGGLIPGGLYYLSGLPGAGKTTLARNILENVAMRGIPVYMWSLEQTAEQVWGSIAARHSRQSVFKLNQGSKHTDFDRLRKSADIVTQWPIHIDERGQTASSLWVSARRAVGKLKCKLLVLDYLQALRDESGSGDNDVVRQTNFSNCVRDIAKTLKVPVLVVSALSRNGELRGSAMLGYDAWAHLKLSQAEDFPTSGQVHVRFEKQRFGPLVEDESLYLKGNEQRFDEVSNERW